MKKMSIEKQCIAYKTTLTLREVVITSASPQKQLLIIE